MDKQIIIDGIDVSCCEDYGYRGKAGHWCHNYDEPCTDYPNCIYKRLKRKEQECEELKGKLKYIRDENVHLKESATDEQMDFLALNNYIRTLEFQIDQLKAENEELKREKRNFYNFLTNKYNYGSFRPMWGTYLLKRFFKEDLGDFFDEAAYEMADTIGEKEKQLDRYSQTLTEIKDIAEDVIKNVSDRCIETTPMYSVHKQILQKISEVLKYE